MILPLLLEKRIPQNYIWDHFSTLKYDLHPLGREKDSTRIFYIWDHFSTLKYDHHPSWQRKEFYKNFYIRDHFSTLKYDPPLIL
jgi:hypothetical protein